MTTLELGKQRAEELGLKLEWQAVTARTVSYYREDDIHKLLGEGVETYTHDQTQSNFNTRKFGNDNMIALQIGVRYIKQETREEQLTKALKELIETITVREFKTGNQVSVLLNDTESTYLAIQKAKALLEREK